jgi:general stress protein 26
MHGSAVTTSADPGMCRRVTTERTIMSDRPTGEVQALEKFRELLREFDDAMLVSLDAEGQFHARPMRIVAHNRDNSDDLWFVTGLESEKIAEIRNDSRVAVTLADGTRFLAICGEARAVVDEAQIEAMWQESWRLWFPNGPKGGGIALIRVLPTRAEYWDQLFPNGLRFAFEAAKASIGEPEQHAKVRVA